MYGIVNKAIEELIVEKFGEEVWEKIHAKSGIDVEFFLSNEPYDDSVTYALAVAATEVLELPLSEILIALGEFWVLNTGKKKYGALMESGGSDLKQFLVNLPNFHNRVSLIYPKLAPPEFAVSHVTENSLNLHYHSHRPGLKEFVRGLIQGLGKFYSTPVSINVVASRDDGHDHEIYAVSW